MVSRGKQVVLITGCSTGIGLATARRLVAAGHVVFATARRAESVEELSRLAGDFPRGSLSACRLDVTDPGTIEQAVARVVEAHGRIDALVNNAGYGQLGAIEELSDEEVQRQLDVNVLGVLRVTRAVLPTMRRNRSGRLINVSSAAGHFALPFMGIYASSKFALEGVSDALRVELRPFGIHVVLVEPGAIATNFDRNAESAIGPKIGAPDSPYTKYFERMRTRLSADRIRRSLPADAVAAVIERALLAKRPKAHYPVGLMAALAPWARCLVPTRLMDGLTRRALGLRGRKRPRGT